MGRNPWRQATVCMVVCALLLQVAAILFACPEGLRVSFGDVLTSAHFTLDDASANCLTITSAKGAAGLAGAALPQNDGPGKRPGQDCPACLSAACQASAILAFQSAISPAPISEALFSPAFDEARLAVELAFLNNRDPPFSLHA